jgi:hypothetical protein
MCIGNFVLILPLQEVCRRLEQSSDSIALEYYDEDFKDYAAIIDLSLSSLTSSLLRLRVTPRTAPTDTKAPKPTKPSASSHVATATDATQYGAHLKRSAGTDNNNNNSSEDVFVNQVQIFEDQKLGSGAFGKLGCYVWQFIRSVVCRAIGAAGHACEYVAMR